MAEPPYPQPEFAHRSEAQFARILDYYQVEWQYEPRTFVLKRDAAGNVLEAFAPDFYLPQQDLYVELTTLRPSLIRIKNRKLRAMKALYPEINIKLFKRRDVEALLRKYGLDEEAAYLEGNDAQKEEA